MNEDLAALIEELSLAVCRENDVDLIQLKMGHQGRRILIDILADKPAGGITIDECAYLNKEIIRRIDTDQAMEDSYTLSVSSPGIDWPLKNEKDFQRVVGKKVKVVLAVDNNNVKKFSGKVLKVADNCVTLQNSAESVLCEINKIQNAVQII